ncbi:MAG: O-methyltransferase [Acidobacteria bacterium]|nr:O-methyltransferase [Acidobacteriota bacterium]
MPEITDSLSEQYLYSLLPERDEVLLEMEREARRRSIPIVGPVVGRLLYQYARILGARRIFEMGSAIGYSTLWLAHAAEPAGMVYYSDGSRANAEQAQAYFRRAGVNRQVQVLVGNAMELIDTVGGEFDLIFNDVDKHQYPEAFHRALPHLRRGGLFVTDNVLWSGRVARDERDPDSQGIREFNRLIYSRTDLYPVILPIRDGVAICLKS